jgi:hypothetical protein
MAVKSKHASVLNALDEMQQSHAYAFRKYVLAEVESIIVAQEAALAEKDTTLEHAATTIGEQSVEIMRLKKEVAEKDAHITTLLDTSAVLKTYQDTLEMLVEKDRELGKLKEWRANITCALRRPGGSFFDDVPKHIKDLVIQRDDLMHQAVWAMEQLHYYMPPQLDTEASRVQGRITEFLSTSEVQTYQAQRVKETP